MEIGSLILGGLAGFAGSIVASIIRDALSRRHAKGVQLQLSTPTGEKQVVTIRPDMTSFDIESAFQTVARETSPDIAERAVDLLSTGDRRFREVVHQRNEQMIACGIWEVALVIGGSIPNLSLDKILDQLNAANPRFTGWPMWLDSRGFRDKESWPYVYEGGWEASISRSDWLGDMTYWRIEPAGRLYQLRVLEDDAPHPMSRNTPQPGTTLEFGLVIWRVAEAIAVGLAFARALGANVGESECGYAFRWTGLTHRRLSSWAHPDRSYWGDFEAYQDSVVSTVSVPAGTADGEIFAYVHKVTQPLFQLFGGHQFQIEVIKELTGEALRRGRFS